MSHDEWVNTPTTFSKRASPRLATPQWGAITGLPVSSLPNAANAASSTANGVVSRAVAASVTADASRGETVACTTAPPPVRRSARGRSVGRRSGVASASFTLAAHAVIVSTVAGSAR
jgi:hypothetical protein